MRNIRILLLALLSFLVSVEPLLAAPEHILSLNLAIAPVHNRWTLALKPWADEISRRSGGRLEIEPYFAQALSKQAEVAESVRSGVADLGEATFTVGGLGRFPFHEQILNLTRPSLSMEDAVGLVRGLHQAFPQEALRDVEGTKLLFVEGHSVGMLIGTRDKPVKSLDDLKGLKIGVSGGGIRVERVKALGATVVGITIPDMYMALEKGIIDGAVVDFEVLVSRKLGDIIRHMTLLNMGGSVFYCVMNQDAFDRLPPDLRQVVDEVSRDFAPEVFGKFWADMQYRSLEQWQKEHGGKVWLLSDEDYARADAAVEPSYAAWIEFARDKGLPAEAIVATYRELESRAAVPWSASRAAAYAER